VKSGPTLDTKLLTMLSPTVGEFELLESTVPCCRASSLGRKWFVLLETKNREWEKVTPIHLKCKRGRIQDTLVKIYRCLMRNGITLRDSFTGETHDSTHCSNCLEVLTKKWSRKREAKGFRSFKGGHNGKNQLGETV